MSILKSMNIGLSGLNANGMALAVIGDNIANVNTAGFKAGRTQFADVMAATTLGAGSGVNVTDVQRQFSMGTMEMTGNALDMAISGSGFLVVRDTETNSDLYTRAGQFGLDKEGFIVTAGGLRLQGYEAKEGEIGGAMADIQVGSLTAPPKPTSSIEISLNLDASAEIQDVATEPFDPANPGETSQYSSSVNIYDSLGSEINADVYYVNLGDGNWEYHVIADGEHIDDPAAVAGEGFEIAGGTLTFDTEGEMTAHVPNAPESFTPIGATSPQELAFDFDDTSSWSTESVTRATIQDGYGAGDLLDIRIEGDGTIYGIFSNGVEQGISQVGLATFASETSLEGLGGNVWKATPGSGEPLVAEAGAGGRGSLVAGALEGSNVDLAYEFVKLIAAQRAFQANSRTITTSDQMYTEVVNMKR